MKLLGDDILERSAVVANCRMNRERNLLGANGYDKELGFSPLSFLKEHSGPLARLAWLDLCCGSGKALIEAARLVDAEGQGSRISIVGVDLVGGFLPPDTRLNGLRLIEASLSTWQCEHSFDLITCVHGLHYIGDKLGLVARAASWLTKDGLFVANLDLNNLKVINGRAAGRKIAADLRQMGLGYKANRRLIQCRGRKALKLPYRYLGADDGAGPNYTGQPAVDSYYEVVHGPSRRE